MTALQAGSSIEEIKRVGDWKSNAFSSYTDGQLLADHKNSLALAISGKSGPEPIDAESDSDQEAALDSEDAGPSAKRAKMDPKI